MVEDIFKYNSNLEGLVLDVGHELDCAIISTTWSADCKKQIQRVIQIKQQAAKRAKYYANISNVYLAVVKLQANQSAGLKALFEALSDDSDYIYLVMDEKMTKAEHTRLLKNLQQLTHVQKQRLMVGFDLAGQSPQENWITSRIADLRRQGI